MPSLLLIRFADASDNVAWHAFSSTDEERPVYKLRKDAFYAMGFQESYPNDRNTIYGRLEDYHQVECQVPLHERIDGLQLVQAEDYTWANGFPIIKVNDSYTQPIPSDFNICQMAHTFIEPNEYYDDAMDTDSDSD
jgi:hypothetical protein